MKRGAMFLGLFLISLLIISGCEQGSYTGYAPVEKDSKNSKDPKTDKSPLKEDFSPIFDSDLGSDSEESVVDDDSSLNCEDYVYSNCPEWCTKYCMGPYNMFPGTGLITTDVDENINCYDVPGSCRTTFTRWDDGICLDFDGDGYGNYYEIREGGYVEENEEDCEIEDCDDTNYLVNPGAIEVCNGFDDNCNTLVDAEDVDAEDIYEDCAGYCFMEFDPDYCGGSCLNWLGDGFCDDGTIYDLDFYCEEWNYDTNEEGISDCGEDYEGSGEEDGGCAPGFEEDCVGQCFDPNGGYGEWIGDEVCDDGTWKINFNCEEWDYDNKDCECEMDDLSRCLYGSNECDVAHKCRYQYCNGYFFTNGYISDDIYEGKGNGGTGGVVISSKRIMSSCKSSDAGCGYYKVLDLLGNGNCDDGTFNIFYFNCKMWNYDDGDCNGGGYGGGNGGSYTPSQEDVVYTDIVNVEDFGEGLGMETLYWAIVDITEKILMEGEKVIRDNKEIYYFEQRVAEEDSFQFNTLLLNVNALGSFGTVYNNKLYLSSEYLTKIYDNLEEVKHTVQVIDFDSTLKKVSFKINSDTIYSTINKEFDPDYIDLNSDGVYDLKLEITSFNEDGTVNLKSSILYPDISTKLENIAHLSRGQTVYSEQSPEEFLKSLVIFAMTLVMFIVSFLLIKKAFHLVKSKR